MRALLLLMVLACSRTVPLPGDTASREDTAPPGDTASADTGVKDTSDTSDTAAPVDPAPDFRLVDANPASRSFGSQVSPRDHLEVVSGWYFTHAT